MLRGNHLPPHSGPEQLPATHDLWHIAPAQLRRTTPSFGEIARGLPEKPAIERDRERRSVAMPEIFGELSVNEVQVDVQPRMVAGANAHASKKPLRKKVARSLFRLPATNGKVERVRDLR